MREPSAISKKISIIRSGESIGTQTGARFIDDYVVELTIMESLNSHTIEMVMVLEDYAGLAATLTGTELYKVEISTINSDRTYYMRAVGYESKIRDGRGSEAYVIRCFSDEYFKNEGRYVFGHTQVLFGENAEASNIIRTLMKDKKYLNSAKKVYAEETLNYHSAVCPGWRPFELIRFLSERSYRKGKPITKDKLQSGFQFFENGMGYQFMSIDKMIEDIKNADLNRPTNPKTGYAALYEYGLQPKSNQDGMDGPGSDYFSLEGFSILEEGNLFRRMREGLFSGYSIGFDPVSLKSSQIGLSADMPSSAFEYNVKDIWKQMEHLDGRQGRNPSNVIDSGIKDYVDSPRRVRYNVIPNNIFDSRNNVNTLNYSQISLLDTYDYVRRSTLKNIIAKAKMPGNLDLYAGKGIKIKIPNVLVNPQSRFRDNDPQYSGRYLISDVTHFIKGNEMTTTLELRRDSFPT